MNYLFPKRCASRQAKLAFGTVKKEQSLRIMQQLSVREKRFVAISFVCSFCFSL